MAASTDPHPDPDQPLDADVDPSDGTVRTPDPDGNRLAEAGHAYVGREASDEVKTHPRVLDADRAVETEKASDVEPDSTENAAPGA